MSDDNDAARVTGGDDGDENPDDELVAEVRALMSRYDPVPPEALAAAHSAIAWRTIDAELAELSAEAELVGVRGVSSPELLSFESRGLTVELEVLAVDGGRRLLGQLVPPGPGLVQVRHEGGSVSVPADEVGRFRADDLAPGPVSLRCSAGPHVVETDWFLI